MEIESLKSFIDVSETLSFSKTAERFFITQSAVSHRIHELEDVCGCPLFLRTNKGVKLTAEGEMLLPDIQSAVDGYERGVKNIHDYLLKKVNSIHIGAITPAVNSFLAPVIGEFGVSHPEIAIEVQRVNPVILKEQVLNGTIDIYISTTSDILESSDWDSKPIISDPFGLIMREGMTCDSIAGAREILSRNKIYTIPKEYSPLIYEKTHQVFSLLKLDSVKLEELYPVESIMFSVASGMGVAVLPSNIFTSMKSFGLRFAPLGVDVYTVLAMAWRKSSPTYTKEFVELVLKNIENHSFRF